MHNDKIAIVDGPDKPALQRSLANALDVHFRTQNDALDATIVRIDEQSDGFTFELRGRITSGPWKDEPFEAQYSVESRSGWLQLAQ